MLQLASNKAVPRLASAWSRWIVVSVYRVALLASGWVVFGSTPYLPVYMPISFVGIPALIAASLHWSHTWAPTAHMGCQRWVRHLDCVQVRVLVSACATAYWIVRKHNHSRAVLCWKVMVGVQNLPQEGPTQKFDRFAEPHHVPQNAAAGLPWVVAVYATVQRSARPVCWWICLGPVNRHT